MSGSTIPNLQTGQTLLGAELLYMVQNGQDRQTSVGAVAALAQAGLPLGGYLPLVGGVVTGLTTFARAGTALAVTNNATIGGRLLVGSGTIAGGAYGFQAAFNSDPSAGPFDTRQSMFNTTLTYATTSGNIWENLNSFVYVNGPGIASGEINVAHTYFQVNAGGNAQVAEGYESSGLNNGIVGTWSNYLGIFNNGPSGTATFLNGMVLYLTNQNTAAGSIGEWDAISVGAMQGGGSRPTFYNAMKIADANAGIVTLGGILVGALGNATPGQLTIQGPDNSGGTFPFLFRNLAGNVFYFADDATATFSRAGVIIQPPTIGPNLFVQGSDNSGSTFPFAIKNLANANLLSVANNGLILTANGAVVIQPASVGPALFLQSGDNSSGTFLMAAKNLATTNLFSIASNGAIAMTAAGVTIQPGSVGPALNIQGADNNGGTFAISLKNLAAANLFAVANNGDIAAGVTGHTFGITGALTASQNIATSGGVYFVGVNQVVGARQTGWAAMTGTPNIAAVYDTATVTLAQLAGRVMAMQASSTTHGQIGP